MQALATDPALRVYAVMDGSLIDDLPRQVQDNDLFARALVKDEAGQDLVAVGPWLVDPSLAPVPSKPDISIDADAELTDEALAARAAELAQDAKAALDAGEETAAFAPQKPDWTATDPAPRLEAIMRLASGTSGVVFWCVGADLTSERLFQHLRGIAKVRMGGAGRADGGEDMVLFRHADANVLVQVLPALKPAQTARLLGPADQILFLPDREWAARPQRLRRTPDLPEPAAGLLVLDTETVRAIEARRLIHSHARIAAYLRDVAPDRTAEMSDDALHDLLLHSDAKAAELGVRTERGRGWFSYLMLLTDRKAADMPEVRSVVASGESSPENQLRRLLRTTATQVRQAGATS